VVAADADGVEMIGNYPQAFSHIGLVNAAWAIAQAEADARRGEPDFLDALSLEDVTLVHSDWGGALFLTARGLDHRVARQVILPSEAFENFPPGLPGRMVALAVRLPGGIQLAARQLPGRLAAPAAVAVRADGAPAGARRAHPALDRTGAERPGRPSRPARLHPGTVRQGSAGKGHRGTPAVPGRRAGVVVAGQPGHASGARSSTRGADATGAIRGDPGRVRAVHARRTRGGGARDRRVPHVRRGQDGTGPRSKQAVRHTGYRARPGAAAWSVAGLDAPAHGAA
jgi:hypothetical protein